MRIPVPLGFPLGQGRSKAAGLQGLVNLYGENVQAEGRTQLALYATPGRKAFATIGGGAVRGQINTGSRAYAVIGTQLYLVNSDGTSSALGGIEGSAQVDMAYNGQQITIVAELKSYTYDVIGLTLAEIPDGDFVQASSCAALASYSIFARKGTGQFAWSSLLDATAYDPLDFATAESEPDNLLAVRRRGNELCLGGSNSTEFWGLTGDSNAPFARVSTAAATIGWISRDSGCLVDNGLVWAGQDGLAGGRGVYRAEGYIPKKISTPQVDLLLEATNDPTELRAFAYQKAGHQFYVLTHPQEWTIAWDILTGQWSYRRTGDYTMGAEPTGGWNAVTFALNGSKQIVGSDDGNLYELDHATLTDAGSTLAREVTFPTLSFGGAFQSVDRFEVEIERGVGLVSGQGSAPLMMLSYSKNAGATWSAPRTASMGAMGQNSVRVFWTRCGRAKDFTPKLRVTDPVKTVIVSAFADVS
jgi:hypothetical protein